MDVKDQLTSSRMSTSQLCTMSSATSSTLCKLQLTSIRLQDTPYRPLIRFCHLDRGVYSDLMESDLSCLLKSCIAYAACSFWLEYNIRPSCIQSDADSVQFDLEQPLLFGRFGCVD